jgi:hypothetical protein
VCDRRSLVSDDSDAERTGFGGGPSFILMIRNMNKAAKLETH